MSKHAEHRGASDSRIRPSQHACSPVDSGKRRTSATRTFDFLKYAPGKARQRLRPNHRRPTTGFAVGGLDLRLSSASCSGQPAIQQPHDRDAEGELLLRREHQVRYLGGRPIYNPVRNCPRRPGRRRVCLRLGAVEPRGFTMFR